MGVAIEIFQRQACQLVLHVSAQAEHGALRHPGHDVGEHPLEQRGEDVDQRRQDQDLPERREIDPLTGHHVGAGNQVRDLPLPVGAKLGDGLRLGEARRQRPADHAVEDHVRRVADDLGPDHGEGDVCQGESGRYGDRHPLGTEPLKELPKCLVDVLGFLGRQLHPAEAAATKAAHRGTRRRPGGSVRSAVSTRSVRDHATASSPSWDSTISR